MKIKPKQYFRSKENHDQRVRVQVVAHNVNNGELIVVFIPCSGNHQPQAVSGKQFESLFTPLGHTLPSYNHKRLSGRKLRKRKIFLRRKAMKRSRTERECFE